jgi:hypothetical protein
VFDGGDSDEDDTEEDTLPELNDNIDSGDTEEDTAEEEGDTDDAEQQVKSTGGKEGGKDLVYRHDNLGPYHLLYHQQLKVNIIFF